MLIIYHKRLISNFYINCFKSVQFGQNVSGSIFSPISIWTHSLIFEQRLHLMMWRSLSVSQLIRKYWLKGILRCSSILLSKILWTMDSCSSRLIFSDFILTIIPLFIMKKEMTIVLLTIIVYKTRLLQLKSITDKKIVLRIILHVQY